MSNAIKYTPKNGRISITAGRNSGSVWLKVEDSGPGIAVAEQARVFEPFYRGAANRRFADGMGLGLSIAHELVTAHNGRLTLTSVPGQGSQFTIWLPYSESGRL